MYEPIYFRWHMELCIQQKSGESEVGAVTYTTH